MGRVLTAGIAASKRGPAAVGGREKNRRERLTG